MLITRIRLKNVYQLYGLSRAATRDEVKTRITENKLPSRPEEQNEVKRYLEDPVRYNLALELKEKHEKTETTAVDFFSPATNSVITKLPESAQEGAKNSMAHLSFRSGLYIAVILLYICLKFIVITHEERAVLWAEDTEIRKNHGPDSITETLSDFSWTRFAENLKNLNFGRFRRSAVSQTAEQQQANESK